MVGERKTDWRRSYRRTVGRSRLEPVVLVLACWTAGPNRIKVEQSREKDLYIRAETRCSLSPPINSDEVTANLEDLIFPTLETNLPYGNQTRGQPKHNRRMGANGIDNRLGHGIPIQQLRGRNRATPTHHIRTGK